MSDLTPPVAATQRDEVMKRLQEEICSLKERLKISQRVEIVSDEGQGDNDDKMKIVHAEGNLEEGRFENAGNLFVIDSKKKHVCPLSNLKNVRICLGGFHRAYFREKDITELDFTSRDGDTDNSKSIHVGGGMVGLFWLSFIIHNWPREHWETIIANELRNPSNVYMGKSLLTYITLHLPESFPGAYVTFNKFSLLESDNRGAINNLPESLLSKLEEGLDIDNMRMNILYSLFDLFDERYSESDLWSLVGPKDRLIMVSHVKMILIQFYGIRVIDSDLTQTVGRIIEMYWECRSMTTNWEEESDWQEDFFRQVLTETQGIERAAEAATAYSFASLKSVSNHQITTSPDMVNGPDMVNDGDTDDDNSDYDEDAGDENGHDSE